jgi:hypothetical protein
MALIGFCYSVAQFFLGVFFILACVVALVVGVIGLVLLCTPFPYFPIHREFLIRFWTFVVTASFFANDYGHKSEWDKVKSEMRQLSSWQTAKNVIHLTKED